MKIELYTELALVLLMTGAEVHSSALSLNDDDVQDISTDIKKDCRFECDTGEPAQNPDYKPSFNGCGSYGVNVDFKKCPYLTECCNQHDLCYDICGTTRDTCDTVFKTCTQSPPSTYSADNKSLCTTYGNMMYLAVRAAGCPAFKNAQKNCCICI